MGSVTDRKCTIDGCDKPYRARGFCINHYNKARADGMPLTLPRRKDNLCCICGVRTIRYKTGSHCRECHADYERARRNANAATVNARRKELYVPERRRAQNLAKYNLTPEAFDKIMARQGGVCAICGISPAPGTFLHVDHDHSCCPESLRSCGRCVRGLLCTACNNGLGRFRDDATLLAKAIAYLG